MEEEQKKQNFQKALKRYKKQGVSLFIENQLASPKKIAKMHLREDACYMADYVMDDNGTLREIRFDKINNDDDELKK